MPNLSGQFVLVTGATSGIGRVTAMTLAQQGAHVILLARDLAKAEATRAEIRAAAGHDRVDILLADLADLTQVRRVAAEFNARYPRLDVLINNAGLFPTAQRLLSPDGNEVVFATNHLGPFLLTALLFDKLRQSRAARIVNVSSAILSSAKPDLTDLQQTRGYSATRVYANTKLYNVLFTQELARRLRAQGIDHITTNALHPGVVATNFSAGSIGTLMAALVRVFRPFFLSAERGAQTTLFLATSPAVVTVSGAYFVKQKQAPVKNLFATPANARLLWELSETLADAKLLR